MFWEYATYSECSIIRHPPSKLIRIIESSYMAKYLSRPINYPLKPITLWNVGLLGLRLSSIHCIVDIYIIMV